MTKEEIYRVVAANDSTILNFPQRGPWGDNKYRGNCSGYVQASLILKYGVKKFAELFAGSGTGYDVCKDLGISYVGADLNPTPVRPGIICTNAITDEVPASFYGADMIFMHPPYGAEIRIPYAGSMYPDPTGELSAQDLGQMPWDKFMATLNKIVMKYYMALSDGGRMAILMGDVRRNGLHSMLTDIVKPGELEQILIKVQNNCTSYSNTYSSRNFYPLVHEYLMVLKRVAKMMVTFNYPQKQEMNVADSKLASWTDVVQAALEANGGKATLSELYTAIDGHRKTAANPHWQEKIRQVLQTHSRFRSLDRGVWGLAA